MKDIVISFVGLTLAVIVLPCVFKQLELTEVKLKSEKITTKTKNLLFAIDIAKGVVIMAEKFLGTGSEQEDRAVVLLQKRLAENNMSKLFTDTQIRQIIQQVYSLLKVDGTIDAVKEKDVTKGL